METDLNKLRDRAYQIAKAHGFHEKEQSDETYLMLIITEISEAVNADRKGEHAKLNEFTKVEKGLEQWYTGAGKKSPQYKNWDKNWSFEFRNKIKDSVEDELADVAICLLDFAGARKVKIIKHSKYSRMSDRHSFCENCYKLCEETTEDYINHFIDITEKINYVLEVVCRRSTFIIR